MALWLEQLSRWASRAVYRAPGELVRCPACGSAALSALSTHKLPNVTEGRRTGLVTGCEDCGLVFVNPPPSADELAAMYSTHGEWAAGRQDEVLAPPVDASPTKGTWRLMFDPIRDELDVTHPPPGAAVLDFGCGRGKFLDVLKACGWNTFGIEPAMDVAFTRHQRLQAIPEAPAFDLLIVNHVLEHVIDPLTLLTQLAAAARPGAHLFVGVPRLDTLPIHRDRSYVSSRVHVTSYTSACLLNLLSRAGWEGAPPPDEISIAGGRRTTARLRVLARRVESAAVAPRRPLDQARRAFAEYARQWEPEPLSARIGGPRLAARAIESKRQLRRWGYAAGVLRRRDARRQGP